ncbi:UNVERIFIED_CONTAM: hypothetical protein HDU68_011365 [Siphonaria sp. JEL0065]|nr:hypothetical protein HDU68_011365 [Siphonaria sp. JEL0065]
MGGNALTNTKRLTTADHQRLATRLIPLLKQSFKFAAVPRYLPTKESHGDFDVVVTSGHGLSLSELKNILALSSDTEAVLNGDMASLCVEGFQMDVTAIKPESSCSCDRTAQHHQEVFDAHVGFMDWGDLSRIIGVVAKRMGLIYSSLGLIAPVMSSDVTASPPVSKETPLKIDQIVLTHSIPQALEYLKYPSQKWIDGFQNDLELFEFIVSSPFFSRLDVLSWLLKAKAGDKVRPGVVKFRDYLLELNGGVEPTDEQVSQERLDKYSAKVEAIVAFGKMSTFETILREYKEKCRVDAAMKIAFSGDVIMAVIGQTSGKNVGIVKERVRKLLIQSTSSESDPDAWKKQVANMPKENIDALIQRIWSDIQK